MNIHDGSEEDSDVALVLELMRVWWLNNGSASDIIVSLSSDEGNGSLSCLTF